METMLGMSAFVLFYKAKRLVSFLWKEDSSWKVKNKKYINFLNPIFYFNFFINKKRKKEQKKDKKTYKKKKREK